MVTHWHVFLYQKLHEMTITLKSLIWPVMMYRCEAWTLRAEELSKINAAELLKDRRTNESILSELNTKRILLSENEKKKTQVRRSRCPTQQNFFNVNCFDGKGLWKKKVRPSSKKSDKQFDRDKWMWRSISHGCPLQRQGGLESTGVITCGCYH